MDEQNNIQQQVTQQVQQPMQSGYHKREIPKGVLGEFSKITEEFTELFDAVEQQNSILELCEMADLLGAIKHYSEKRYNIGLDKLIMFMECTENAFKAGKR